MPLNLPLEVWVMLIGAGMLFLSPMVFLLAMRGVMDWRR